MTPIICRTSLFLKRWLLTVTLCLSSNLLLWASDHADTERLKFLGRRDARIGDFYAFVANEKLVLAMTIYAELPQKIDEFRFPSDVIFRFMIDRNSDVTFDDSEQLKSYGGTIVKPDAIKEDIVVEITFSKGDANPRMVVDGLKTAADNAIALFAGVRDEPFIRGPLIGHNIGAIVVELPLKSVLADSRKSTLLLWCTTDVVSEPGPMEDIGARAYRSQFPANEKLNTHHPSEHMSKLKLVPDVVIFDTGRPAAFPNGRALTDDVLDVVGPEESKNNDEPFPAANDVPFSDTFPYLAPPHRPHTHHEARKPS